MKRKERFQYDTGTSCKVASYSNGLPFDNPKFISEDLYRSKKGDFFLLCKGGVDTVYSFYFKESAEVLVPLTKKEVDFWLQCNFNFGYDDLFRARCEFRVGVEKIIPLIRTCE